MKFSIVIPTINSSKRSFLDEALASAIAVSSSKCDEIIIIDNSLDSNFHEYLQSKTESDSRIRIVNVTPKLSMAENWNKGLSEVQNEWHLYLHDDDILNVHEINKLEIGDKESGMLTYDFNILENGIKTKVCRKPGLKGILENTPKFVATFFSTSKLRAIGGWDENAGYFLDFLVFIKLYNLYGFKHYGIVVGDYRIHATNASHEEKRERGYGDHFPYVLEQLFSLYKDTEHRKQMLNHMLSFVYPASSLTSRVPRKILSLLGKNAWLSN